MPFTTLITSPLAFLAAAASLSLVTASHGRMQHVRPHGAGEHKLYLSGYDGNIQAFTFTPPSTLTPGPSTSAGMPSWLAFASYKDHAKTSNVVYAVNEDVPGTVFALEQGKNRELTVIGNNQQKASGTPSGGDGPVALAFTGEHFGGHGENCLWASNYNTGSVGVLTIQSDGTLSPTVSERFNFTRPASGPPVGPVTSRQDHSYAHEVVTSPDARFIYVPDLGADQLHAISVGSTCSDSKVASSTTVPPGNGPRHLAFYPPGKSTLAGMLGTQDETHHHHGKTNAYLSCELSSSLIPFEVDTKTGALKQIGEPVPSVPPGTPLGGTPTGGPQRTVAEVAISPDGRFVYVSDRGDGQEDHVTIYARDVETGAIKWLKWVPSGGQNPRHFSLSLDKDAKYLAIGHQNTSNALIFERDVSSGDIKKLAEYKGFPQLAFTGFAPF